MLILLLKRPLQSSSAWRIPSILEEPGQSPGSGRSWLNEWMKTCPLPPAESGSCCPALWKFSVPISVTSVNICVVAALKPGMVICLSLSMADVVPNPPYCRAQTQLRIRLNIALDSRIQQTEVCTRSEVSVTSPKVDCISPACGPLNTHSVAE